MKRSKFVISAAGYTTRFVEGAIAQINGYWYGFEKCERYKKRGHSKYTHYRATELSTGMSVNPEIECLTRSECVEYCRSISDDVEKVITSNKEHISKLKKMVRKAYEDCGMTDMVKRLYG